MYNHCGVAQASARSMSTTWLPELGPEMIIALSRTTDHAIIIREGIYSERNKTGHVRVIQRKNGSEPDKPGS